jgi:phage antirepressor YoqD-like protein
MTIYQNFILIKNNKIMKRRFTKKPKLYTVAEATAITNFPAGSIKFFAWLREKKYLKTSNLPYQRFRDKGWFEVRETTTRHPLNPLPHFQTLFTWRGLKNIGDRVQKDFTPPPCPPQNPCPPCPPVPPCKPCEEQNNLN